eukprot:CAMPEP_0180281788 /NCGR_PEP_ID=MMETSP0988-20121125/9412_1 /TAXON_ID=697907 /ORGANISM="non described non described, Strain CCMP2293" /LENGTH=62 /DNA_ID=CAMNT_0022253843 /DNA_START=323 /DNA_END=511 /DNA_ORIENTATION=-
MSRAAVFPSFANPWSGAAASGFDAFRPADPGRPAATAAFFVPAGGAFAGLEEEIEFVSLPFS